MTDTFDIHALKFHLRSQNYHTQGCRDPYRNLPIIFGSIFDTSIPSTRMINVKHQAALNWALKRVETIKGKHV